jgi:hypothetical protein
MSHTSPKLDFTLLQVLYTDARFDAMVRALDKLHDAASEGRVSHVSDLPRHELIGWLEEIVYTAQETIRELEADTVTQHETALPGQGFQPQLVMKEAKEERMAVYVRTSGN